VIGPYNSLNEIPTEIKPGDLLFDHYVIFIVIAKTKGKTIEKLLIGDSELNWEVDLNPVWNFEKYRYRVYRG
jgi:hypothetical protein